MISFEEFYDPTGQEMKVVLLDRPGGGQTVIGYIETTKKDKQNVYIATDTAGKQIYAHNYSLKQVKKEFQRHEEEFRQQAQLQEQNRMNRNQSFEQLVAEFEQEKERKNRLQDLKHIRSRKTKTPALSR